MYQFDSVTCCSTLELQTCIVCISIFHIVWEMQSSKASKYAGVHVDLEEESWLFGTIDRNFSEKKDREMIKLGTF